MATWVIFRGGVVYAVKYGKIPCACFDLTFPSHSYLPQPVFVLILYTWRDLRCGHTVGHRLYDTRRKYRAFSLILHCTRNQDKAHDEAYTDMVSITQQ